MTEQDDPRPEGLLDAADARLRALGRRLVRLLRRGWTAARSVAARVLANPVFRRRARLVGRDVALAALLAFVTLAVGALLFERVEPGTVGVRQTNWGTAREIGAVDRAPGLHFGPRPIYSWHHLDARTQVLDFAPDSEGGEHPPLQLRSASGTTVTVAVSVPYRIRPGLAHAIVRDGLKLAWPMRVRSTVENVLAQELSKLDAEAFADPALRREACARALGRLNEELAVHHVVAEDVLVRGFQYAPTYEKKKREEQLAGQTLETNEVLVELKRKRLENEFLAQQLRQERDVLSAEWSRRILADEDVWRNQHIEDQKIENQFLALEIERQKKGTQDRLAREFAETRREERDAALEAQRLATREVAQRVARDEATRAAELARALADAERAAQEGIAAARARNELAAAELAREAGALAAELELATENERIESLRDLRAIEREADDRARELRGEADREHLALLGEGERARSEAAALRDSLRAQALAHPGARTVLARDAASSLRLDRVTLDANDPRVPTVLDLDALVALLAGAD